MFQYRSEKNATVQSEFHMVTVLQYSLETLCLCASFDKVYSTAMRQWVYCSIWDSLQSSSDEGMQYSSETCESVQYSSEGNTIWKGSTGTVQNKYDFVQSSVLSTVQRHCDSVGYCSTVQRKCDWYSASTTCTVQRLILHSTTEQLRENVILYSSTVIR